MNSARLCEKCSNGCLSCFGKNSNQCTNCVPGMYFNPINNTCSDQCPSPMTSNPYRLCLSDQTCSESFLRLDGICRDSCPTSYIPLDFSSPAGLCTACSEKCGGKCLGRGAHEQCLECPKDSYKTFYSQFYWTKDQKYQNSMVCESKIQN